MPVKLPDSSADFVACARLWRMNQLRIDNHAAALSTRIIWLLRRTDQVLSISSVEVFLKFIF